MRVPAIDDQVCEQYRLLRASSGTVATLTEKYFAVSRQPRQGRFCVSRSSTTQNINRRNIMVLEVSPSIEKTEDRSDSMNARKRLPVALAGLVSRQSTQHRDR